MRDFEKRYFEGVERFEENMLALYDPDEIIKKIVEDNYFNLSIIEIRDFINKCLDFYNEYEKRNPKIFEGRKRAIEENEAFEKWEDQWLSPD